MPVSRRYSPEKPPNELSVFGFDYSPVLPPGVGITSGSLEIFTNAATPQPADSDWVKGPVSVRGRAIYATLGGGKSGQDYRLVWSATDSRGNTWPRTALILVSETS